MPDPVLPGIPPIPVTLRFSPRATRLSLRVSRLDGRVTLTAPRFVSEAEAMAFAHERAEWVRGHLAQFSPARRIEFGSRIPVEGRERLVVEGGRGRPQLTDTEIRVAGDSADPGGAVEALLKHLARDRLSAASQAHAYALGRQFKRLTLRDTRSRWGSCSVQGAVMYSWRLVLAPPEVLDYVAAHEIAHLAEMNHSDRFWAVTARLCPDYARHRAWLREHGSGLHLYRFRD